MHAKAHSEIKPNETKLSEIKFSEITPNETMPREIKPMLSLIPFFCNCLVCVTAMGFKHPKIRVPLS